MTILKDRAVIVKFTDRCWIGGKRDKKATQEVESANNAKSGTGHYWKRLVPKAALRDRSNLGASARVFHDRNTSPWLGGGFRILPAANFQDYMAGMRKFQAEAEASVRKFEKEYNGWIAEAKRTQGKLFNPDHYPPVSQIREKFGFDIKVVPLPNIADWSVDLSDSQIEEIRKQAEADFAEVQKEGVKELYERLTFFLDRANKRLSDKQATFRDSLVGNIKEMVGLIAKLNVGNDPNLEAIRKETEAKFAKVGPNTLRVDPVARNKAATDASAIMAKTAAFMGGAKVELPVPVAKPKAKKTPKVKVASDKRISALAELGA